MKAWVLHSIGNITLDEVETPLPGKGEVLVRVKAAGICGSDIPRIYETGAHDMPLIPGHEFSGIVESVGKDVPDMWKGKRVAVCPKIPCGACSQCQRGNLNACTNYDYIGSRRNGAFAEYVTVPATNLLEIPDEVSFEVAAMLEPLAVAVNAIGKGIMGNFMPGGSPIAVWGLGTVGLMVVRLLQDAGHHNIYVIGKREGQKKRAVDAGIPEDHYIDGKGSDIPEQLIETTRGGVSLLFECVGKNECVSGGIDSMAPGGMVVLVGNPYSDINLLKNTYWKILRKQLILKGIWNSAFYDEKTMFGSINDWNYALQRFSRDILRSEDFITHRFSMDDLEIGFRVMRDKKEDYCKIMMTVD